MTDAPENPVPATVPTQKIARQPETPVAAGGKLRAIIPQSMDEMARLSVMVFKSGLAPYGLDSVQKVGVAIMYGMEIGLPPMQALSAIAVINGKPVIYGDAGVALIQNSGLLTKHVEKFTGTAYEDDFTAHCYVKRKGGREAAVEFSVADAKLAKIWQKRGRQNQDTPWITFPKRMLMWRARSFAFRDLFADVLKGLRFVEEAQDDQPIAHEAPALTSGIAARLTGPDGNGFNGDHVHRELNGDHDFPPEEQEVIDNFHADLRVAESVAEIIALQDQYAAQIAMLSDEARHKCGDLADEYLRDRKSEK